MHAVRQGSACVGLRSKDSVVIAALMRSPSELASHLQKVFRIDDHLGIAIAGLTADARVLAKWMRTECLNHKYVYDSNMQISRLVEEIANDHQSNTQQTGHRPYGVGLLVAGYDRTGPHLYETSPSGSYFEYKAMAIGARAQSAKTYITKFYDDGKDGFEGCSREQLIRHAIRSLKGCVHGDNAELTAKNVSVAIVGKDEKFRMVEGEELVQHLTAAMAMGARGESKEAKDDMETDE
jgi:20S proteasome subunit alpha 6